MSAAPMSCLGFKIGYNSFQVMSLDSILLQSRRRGDSFMTLSSILSLIVLSLSPFVMERQPVLAETTLVQADSQKAENEPKLSREEMRQFLLKAKVIAFKRSSEGVTRPYRLTLSDGRITHDGGFQTIDVHKNVETLSDGRVEINFRDSYHYNIAAYELAKLMGLQSMMPVTVERKWEGKTGSLTWWIKKKMNEKERLQKGLHPPDPEAWNNQMFRKRVFANLVGDSDQNITNILIGENWEIYMIDFSRAFRLQDELVETDLVRCDRRLMERMRQLDADAIKRAVKSHLNKAEIQAVLKRRDKLIAHFEKLAAQEGENEVFYE
jgi:hypothetical protein